MTATGWTLIGLSRVRPEVSAAAAAVLSFLIGAGATTLIVFWVSCVSPAAGLTAGLAAMIVSVPSALLLLIVRWRRRPVSGGLPAARALWLLPVAGLLAYQVGVLLVAVAHSGPGWDGTFVWEIKARYFTVDGGVPQRFFADASRLWSHPDYPLLLPLVEALAYRVLGAVSQRVDMAVTAGFVLGLGVLFHELVRRLKGPFLAAILTLVLITVPAFWDNALQAFADLPLALFLLAGTWFVYRWFDHGRRLSDIVLGGVLLALAIWVKREGVVVWATGAAVMAGWTVFASIRARTTVWAPLAAYVAPVVGLVPWWLAVVHGGVGDRDYAGISAPWLLGHADRVPVLLQMLAAQLALLPMWGVGWILIGASIVLRPPLRSPGRRFLLAAVLAHLLALTLVYVLSTWNPYTDHVDASMMRVVFQVFPAGLLLLATAVDSAWWRAFGRADAATAGGSRA